VIVDDLLTVEQGRFLLRVARLTIGNHLGRNEKISALEDAALRKESGTFVTLKLAGQLRGCIGNLEPAGSIYDGIQRNAINAAFNDYRFTPLTSEELERIHIDISILSPASLLSYCDGQDLVRQLRPGIDGLILRHGSAAATFLPQVWEQLPQPEDFLGHLCRKAGLPEKTWRDSHPEILVYQVQCFAEEDI
jgi:AmmeMemoRadiSam system protein A